MYKIILKRKAQKILRKIHFRDSKKVLRVLKEFSYDPFDGRFNIVKLKGFSNLEKAFRLRIGNIRVIYELYQKEKIVIIYFIDYRKTTTYSFS